MNREDQWRQFVETFEREEGFTPNPRDKHAQLLYLYFLAGISAGTQSTLDAVQKAISPISARNSPGLSSEQQA